MARKNQKKRVAVPLVELEEIFSDKMRYLRNSCLAFDQGDRGEFREIAHRMRVLLYHKDDSPSLLYQVGLSEIDFISFSRNFDGRNLLPDMPFAHITSGKAVWQPTFETSSKKWISFDKWWNEPVYKEPGRDPLLRCDFILIAANQDGGSHAGTHVDKVYRELSRGNSAKFWHMLSGEGKSEFVVGYSFKGDHSSVPDVKEGEGLRDLEKVYIRHIAFEVLISLETAWKKVTGNRICLCGSGRKNRYCCAKIDAASANPARVRTR